MRKKHLVIGFFLVAVIATVNVKYANSNIAFPKPGNCGDPVTGETCAKSGCHPGPTVNSTSSTLNMVIGTGNPTTPFNSGFQYVNNTTYNIGFSILASAATNPYYGFQLTALDASNNPAGTFTITTPSNTLIDTSVATGSIRYMSHKGASANRNWTFKWKSPSTATPVIFYYAYNVCAASKAIPDTSEGTIYTGSFTIQGGALGVNDLSDKLSDLNVFPNPVTNEFGVSFQLKEANHVQAQLFSLNGDLITDLMNEQFSEGACSKIFDINNVPQGIYWMRLNVGDGWVSKKIVKQ